MALIDDDDIKASDWLKMSEFHQIPPDKKNQLLMADPEFAKLDNKQKMEYLTKNTPSSARGAAPQGRSVLRQDGDFLGTLGKDALSIPGNIYNAVVHPINTAKSMYQAQADQFNQIQPLNNPTQSPVMQGMENVGHAVAGALPIVGPMAANAGGEIGRGLAGSGETGTGTAHALEALMMGAPKMVGKPVIANTLGKIPIPGAAQALEAAKAGAREAFPKSAKAVDAVKKVYAKPEPEPSDVELFDKSTRKVSRPIKNTGSSRTTDDLNVPDAVEEKPKAAPVDKGIVNRVERAKQLTSEEGQQPENTPEPPKTQQSNPAEEKVETRSEQPGSETYNATSGGRPPISKAQKESYQQEFRVPKAKAYAQHFNKLGLNPEDVGKLTHEQWQAYGEELDQHLPHTATIDRIKAELAGEILRTK